MDEGNFRNTAVGFAVAAALFGAVDGWLIGDIVGGIVGAIIGALVGVGVVLLSWRPRPQDTALIEHGPHPNYMAVWLALFIMTIIEVGVAFVAISKTAIILTLVVLAVWKAVMVALYYMHLKYEPRRMWLLAASPLPLAIILVSTLLIERWGGG
jgi:cytochrome c oxidase subunit IV